MKLKILSYNIHKGVSTTGLDFTLHEIKRQIRDTGANLVCLQEVAEYKDEIAQFEFLADTAWKHYSYGKNAVYDRGHHGNAILSEFPILSWSNTNISTNRFESRGFLHCEIQPESSNHPIHVITVHLDLLERGRVKQIKKLIDWITIHIPTDAPLVVAGDFNDWTGYTSRKIQKELKMREAFQETNGTYAKTFPSYFPILKLDRIIFKNLNLVSAEVLHGPAWSKLSDHLPLTAVLETNLKI
jgi:endonuclease/exonuclease/phosphatase family metal-dependent hydrolase